jgi:hypothetical protein
MTTEDRGRRLSLIGGLSDLGGGERWRKHVLYCDGSLKGLPVKFNVQVILQGAAQMRAKLLSITGDSTVLKLYSNDIHHLNHAWQAGAGSLPPHTFLCSRP